MKLMNKLDLINNYKDSFFTKDAETTLIKTKEMYEQDKSVWVENFHCFLKNLFEKASCFSQGMDESFTIRIKPALLTFFTGLKPIYQIHFEFENPEYDFIETYNFREIYKEFYIFMDTALAESKKYMGKIKAFDVKFMLSEYFWFFNDYIVAVVYESFRKLDLESGDYFSGKNFEVICESYPHPKDRGWTFIKAYSHIYDDGSEGLSEKIFTNALFSGNLFIEDSVFVMSKFENCTFYETDLSGFTILNTIFINCKFQNVDFSLSNLFGVEFNNCDIRNSDFRGINYIPEKGLLPEPSILKIADSNLYDCDLSDIKPEEIVFENTQIINTTQ